MRTQHTLILLAVLGLAVSAGSNRAVGAPPARLIPADFPAELLPIGEMNTIGPLPERPPVEGLPNQDVSGRYDGNLPNGGRAIGWGIPENVVGDAFPPFDNGRAPVDRTRTPVEDDPPAVDISNVPNDDVLFFGPSRRPTTRNTNSSNSAWPSGLLNAIDRTRRGAEGVVRTRRSGR